MDRRLFKAEVKKQLVLHNWSYEDLAKHTKYTAGSIRTIMSTDSKLNEKQMAEIADALGIALDES